MPCSSLINPICVIPTRVAQGREFNDAIVLPRPPCGTGVAAGGGLPAGGRLRVRDADGAVRRPGQHGVSAPAGNFVLQAPVPAAVVQVDVALRLAQDDDAHEHQRRHERRERAENDYPETLRATAGPCHPIVVAPRAKPCAPVPIRTRHWGVRGPR